ncbi:expansin EXLX1 family cellulose-binding protein [Actinomadura hibisca]|uniref:expansin EXLX1 family cellulose-binding protein n=1 Tax=Actinomadura hibisca TaxID=68565 RepID=UPI0009FDE026|nr:expansin EXLX1 family cellulose-binding protein [Actinomadura hibisca]
MHATPRRRPSPRWVWAALSIAAIAALALGAIRLQEGACAAALPPSVRAAGHAPLADPSPDFTGEGTAVFHRDWSEVLCSLGPLPPGGLYASLSAREFGRAELCGAYLEIEGPRGTVRVMVADRCQGCGSGHLDLSEEAFRRAAGGTARGTAPVRYGLLRDPGETGRLAFRVKSGSSAGWLALLVTGHGNPLARVEVRQGDRWRELSRGMDNQWTATGLGGGPFTVRVTDRYGGRAVARDIALSPGRSQSSDARLYGRSEAGRDRDASPTPRPTPAPAVPSTTPTPPGAAPPAARTAPGSGHEGCH